MKIIKVIFLVLVFLTTFFCFPQSQLPACVKMEHNKFIFTEDSSSMLKFYKKIDEMQLGKRKKVSIIHYGGSHVEAGHWDEVFIDHLQNTISKFEGGGMWAFPFKLANSNSPPFYKTYSSKKWQRCRSIGKENCSVFGMNGITVNTNTKENNFAIALSKNFHHQYFTSIKVYHNFNSAYHFNIDVNSGLKYKQTQLRKEGYSLFQFESPCDSVSFLLEKTDTTSKSEFTLYGFSLETNEPGFYYADMGFNGASTKSYIDAELLAPQLKSLSPDLIIFSIGVNDVQAPNFTKEYFYNNYDSIIAKVKSVAPECAIIFTTVTDNYMGRRRGISNKKSEDARKAIIDLCKKHKAGYWDLFMLMGGQKSIVLWQKVGLASKDRVHFSTEGYHLIGNLMFEAFQNSYNYNSLLKNK